MDEREGKERKGAERKIKEPVYGSVSAIIATVTVQCICLAALWDCLCRQRSTAPPCQHLRLQRSHAAICVNLVFQSAPEDAMRAPAKTRCLSGIWRPELYRSC